MQSMQANQLDAMAREKLTKLVNSRVRPWIWILVVFSLVVLAEYLIFSRSQYVASDPTLCECKSVKPKQARILNGIAVPKDDLRWVASIYTIKPHKQKPEIKYEHICSAALITDSYLLTSSYCGENMERGQKQYAAVGGSDRKLTHICLNEPNFRRIEKYHTLNVKANQTGRQYSVIKNNLALAKLEKPFKLGASTNIFLACLQEQPIASFANDLLVASYGEKDDEHSSMTISKAVRNGTEHMIMGANELWMANMREFPNCIKAINNFNASNEFCMESPASALLKGDMGSPLHYEIKTGRHYVVGVETSENPGQAALFGQVYRNLKWIESIVGPGNRCTDVRTWSPSFKSVLWLILFFLITFAAALTALYFTDRPAYEAIRDCSRLLGPKQIQPYVDDDQAVPPESAQADTAAQASPPPSVPASPPPSLPAIAPSTGKASTPPSLPGSPPPSLPAIAPSTGKASPPPSLPASPPPSLPAIAPSTGQAKRSPSGPAITPPSGPATKPPTGPAN